MLTQCPFNMAANSWGRNLLKDTVNVYNKQVRRQNAALSHSTEQVKISAEILVPHFTHVHRRCHLRCIIVKVDGTFKTCTYAPCMCTNEHYNVRICALAFLWNVIIYFYCLSLHFMQHVRSRIVPLLFNKWMTDWMNKGRISNAFCPFVCFSLQPLMALNSLYWCAVKHLLTHSLLCAVSRSVFYRLRTSIGEGYSPSLLRVIL